MWKKQRFGVLSGALLLLAAPLASAQTAPAAVRVTIPSDGWELIGDLQLPQAVGPYATVLMFNRANGDRSIYQALAEQLARRGVASLRIDLRGHGESVNLGRFEPGKNRPDPLIVDAEKDVIAALGYLQKDERFDSDRLAMIGASYSGEEVAEAGRLYGYAQAYVLLSPGSLSEESILAIDRSGVPWLYVASRDERFLQNITASVQAQCKAAELDLLPGASHATNILRDHPETAERVAVWLSDALRVSSVTGKQPALELVAAAVEAREVAFAKTMADRDFAAFQTFLSPEAIFFDGATPLKGTEAISSGWRPYFEGEAAPFSWHPDLVQVLQSGELALSTGPVVSPSGEVIGRFNSIWRKDADGQWRVVFDKGS